MVDIHSHLFFEDFSLDREAVLERAFSGGVKRLLSIAVNVETFAKAIEIAKLDTRIGAALGVHPHTFNEIAEAADRDARLGHMLAALEQALDDPKAVAIGECGLDYFSRTPEPIAESWRAFQKKGFVVQVQVAIKRRLPLIIHCRDAYGDLFEILKRELRVTDFELPAILHCYVGDTEITRRFLDLPNVYFSFAGNITYPVKKALVGTELDLSQTVRLVPLNRIFTETDCPFLAPQAYRGKRNEPVYVQEVVKCIAALQQVNALEVERATEENFHKVFNLH